MAPSRGFGLFEALVSLSLLAVGLLAVAGLVRSVAEQMEWARVTGESALVGRQALEAALADTAAAPARTDTVRVGARSYATRVINAPVGPRLDGIQAIVTVLGPPGHAFGPVRSVYSTYRAQALPTPLPP